MNTFNVLKIASQINGLKADELQVLAECLNESKADSLASFISYVTIDRQINKEKESVYFAD